MEITPVVIMILIFAFVAIRLAFHFIKKRRDRGRGLPVCACFSKAGSFRIDEMHPARTVSLAASARVPQCSLSLQRHANTHFLNNSDIGLQWTEPCCIAPCRHTVENNLIVITKVKTRKPRLNMFSAHDFEIRDIRTGNSSVVDR